MIHLPKTLIGIYRSGSKLPCPSISNYSFYFTKTICMDMLMSELRLNTNSNSIIAPISTYFYLQLKPKLSITIKILRSSLWPYLERAEDGEGGRGMSSNPRCTEMSSSNWPPKRFSCSLWYSSVDKDFLVGFRYLWIETGNFLEHYHSHIITFIKQFSPSFQESKTKYDLTFRVNFYIRKWKNSTKF